MLLSANTTAQMPRASPSNLLSCPPDQVVEQITPSIVLSHHDAASLTASNVHVTEAPVRRVGTRVSRTKIEIDAGLAAEAVDEAIRPAIEEAMSQSRHPKTSTATSLARIEITVLLLDGEEEEAAHHAKTVVGPDREEKTVAETEIERKAVAREWRTDD